jgi:hypothetical protein
LRSWASQLENLDIREFEIGEIREIADLTNWGIKPLRVRALAI